MDGVCGFVVVVVVDDVSRLILLIVQVLPRSLLLLESGCITHAAVRALRKQRIDAFIMDVTSAEHIESAVKFIKSKTPQGLGGLINNAGIAQAFVPFELVSRGEFDTVMNVTFLGTVNVTRAMLPLLRKAGGRVVNNTSIIGTIEANRYCCTGSRLT